MNKSEGVPTHRLGLGLLRGRGRERCRSRLARPAPHELIYRRFIASIIFPFWRKDSLTFFWKIFGTSKMDALTSGNMHQLGCPQLQFNFWKDKSCPITTVTIQRIRTIRYLILDTCLLAAYNGILSIITCSNVFLFGCIRTYFSVLVHLFQCVYSLY